MRELETRDNSSEDYGMQFMHGAGQERGLRAGTENVALAVALGAASEMVASDHQEQQRQAALVARLHAAIAAGVEGEIQVNGPALPSSAADTGGAWPRLPNTLSVSFRALSAADILDKVSDVLAASAGAACHSTGSTMSAVLQAMGLSPDYGFGTVRLTVGRYTSEAEVDEAARALAAAANSLWQEQGRKH